MSEQPSSSKPRRVERAPRRATARGRFAIRVGILCLALFSALVLGLAYPALARGDALLHATWEKKWFLLGLLLVPLVFWRSTFGEDRRTPRLLVGTLAPLSTGPSGLRVWLRDVPGVMRSVGLALMVAAMARPVNTLHPQSSSEAGIDIMIVLDMSGSMKAALDNLPRNLMHLAPRRAPGERPTRLDGAKAVIRDFISRRKTDRIGVVVFGKKAYILSPPTLDYQLLDTLVSKMRLGLIDGNATAIGDALGVAIARMRYSHAHSKAVILLTDGDNNAGKISPQYAAHLANVVGVRLYTIQIGNGKTAEIQSGYDLFGQPLYKKFSAPTNPKLLKKLAHETGGHMYVASDAKALEASFHDVLNKLEKTRFEASIATYEDLYRFLLLPGVILLAFDALLRSLLLRRFP